MKIHVIVGLVVLGISGLGSAAVGRPAQLSSPHSVLTGVVAVSPTEAWAVGYSTLSSGTIRTFTEHWDGMSWSVVKSPNPGQAGWDRLNAVWADASGDVWAVGGYWNVPAGGSWKNLALRWDGSRWRVDSPPSIAKRGSNQLTGITRTSDGDVWAVGYILDSDQEHRPTYFMWEESGWTVAEAKFGALTHVMTGVAGVGDGVAVGVGECVENCQYFQHKSWFSFLTAQGWQHQRTPNLGYTKAVAADGPEDVWTVGSGIAAHYDGTTWVKYRHLGAGSLTGIAMVSSSPVVAVGTAGALLWDGTSWSPVPAPAHVAFSGVSLDSPTDGWAIGTGSDDEPILAHWDGTGFTAYQP